MKPMLIAAVSVLLSSPQFPQRPASVRTPDAAPSARATDLRRLVWLAKADVSPALLRTDFSFPRRERGAVIMTDPGLLRAGLADLMSASADSMRGRSRRRMELRLSSARGRVVLELADAGPGLSVQDLAGMYGDGATALNGARRRIERAGGVINVSSQSGAGTVYLIEFPDAG